MTTHLTQEQCHDMWLGSAGAEARAHVAACPQCRAEIEAVAQALGAFRNATQGWSEARAVAPAAQRARAPVSRWIWGGALALAAAVLLVLLPRAHQPMPAASTAAAPAAVGAQAQIARDNLLLTRIDAEVGENTPQPLQPLQVNP